MGKKTYKVTLTTHGPVHIGAGQVIKKSEYIYDFHKKLVHVVDLGKLTKFLKHRNLLDTFTDYLVEYGNRADLKRFLDDQKIQQRDWQAFVTATLPVHQGKANPQTQQGRSPQGRRPMPGANKPMNDLHLMVRDGRGAVYLPGSSLKGALRTVLLEDIKNDSRDNPLFGYIQVSDSLPIAQERLAIYQKIDVNKEAKPMPLYRECIDVGTKVMFRMTIDDDANLPIAEVEKRIKRFYLNYWNNWFAGVANTEGGKQTLKGGLVTTAIHAKNHPQVLFLGGGAGFVSKTLQYQMYDKEKAKREVFDVLTKRFRNIYGKFREVPQNVPLALKATVDDSKNRWYQQGACTIEFEEIK